MKHMRKQRIQYFAYGSNLSQQQITERCPDSTLIGPGKMRGFKLVFTHYSPRWQGGVADISKDPNHDVWGLLYELSQTDLDQLDRYEGHPTVYNRMQTAVQSVQGTTIRNAWVYYVVHKEQFIPPTQKYFNIILEAARTHKFPEAYIAYLKSIQSQ